MRGKSACMCPLLIDRFLDDNCRITAGWGGTVVGPKQTFIFSLSHSLFCLLTFLDSADKKGFHMASFPLYFPFPTHTNTQLISNQWRERKRGRKILLSFHSLRAGTILIHPIFLTLICFMQVVAVVEKGISLAHQEIAPLTGTKTFRRFVYRPTFFLFIIVIRTYLYTSIDFVFIETYAFLPSANLLNSFSFL